MVPTDQHYVHLAGRESSPLQNVRHVLTFPALRPDDGHSLEMEPGRPPWASSDPEAARHPNRQTPFRPGPNRGAATTDRSGFQRRQEELDSHVERLRPRPGIVELLVEGGILPVAVVAQAQPQDETASRHPVEGGGLLGDDLGAAPGRGVTSVPIVTCRVASATAARVTHGSAKGWPVLFQRWSQTKKPSQPAASAVAAGAATVSGWARSPLKEVEIPQRNAVTAGTVAAPGILRVAWRRWRSMKSTGRL